MGTIRPEVDGVAKEVGYVYGGVAGGETRLVKKAYCSVNGKAAIFWRKRGTQENPYRIKTAVDFRRINEDLEAYYLLEDDIEINNSTSSNYAYYQIGDENNPFTGHFDGGGHRIKISNAPRSDTLTGFFARNEGIIQRASFEASSISVAAGCVGGLVAGKNAGTIRYCRAKTSALYNPDGSQGAVVTGLNDGIISNIESSVFGYDLSAGYGSYFCGVVSVNNKAIEYCSITLDFLGMSTSKNPTFYAVADETNTKCTVKGCKWHHTRNVSKTILLARTGPTFASSNNKQLLYGQFGGDSNKGNYSGFDFNKYWRMTAVGPTLTFAEVL